MFSNNPKKWLKTKIRADNYLNGSNPADTLKAALAGCDVGATSGFLTGVVISALGGPEIGAAEVGLTCATGSLSAIQEDLAGSGAGSGTSAFDTGLTLKGLFF